MSFTGSNHIIDDREGLKLRQFDLIGLKSPIDVLWQVDQLFSFQYRRFILSLPLPGRMHVVVNSDLVPIFVWVPLLHRCIVEVVHKSRMPDQELCDFHYIVVIVVILSVCIRSPRTNEPGYNL